MVIGKTIQIFLPDGNPRGVKKTTVTTEKIEIIQIPRSMLTENKELLTFAGVYLLVDSLQLEKPEIYIGKGNVKQRVSSHDVQKDFWNIVFAIRLKDEVGFNDAHNSYLESYFVNRAKRLKRSIMNENKQVPALPPLDEGIVADLHCYIHTIELLLSTLGLKCFQSIESKENKKEELLYCSDKYGNHGVGEYTEEGFLLKKGAVCKMKLHPGTNKLLLRDKLIDLETLKIVDGHYILQDDQLITSVSSAASLVLGRRSNGWTEWKNERGIPLDELKRK